MTSEQTGLENVNIEGDAEISVSQEIHHGNIEVSGGVVNVNNLFIGTTPQNQPLEHHKPYSYDNLRDRKIDRNNGFLGRDPDLDKIHELLQKESHQTDHLPTVLIFGMAGIGKSELARQYGKLHRADFAGGVGIFDAVEFGEQIRDFIQQRFCEDLDLRYQRNLKAQVAEAWQAWLNFCGTDRSALIIIDDVTDYHSQVAPYLPPKWGNPCPFRFVLTSRFELHGIGSKLELKELTTEAAVQVLTQWADPHPQNVTDHPDLAARVCERLGCLPLALTLVGSWLSLTERPLTEAVTKLEQQGLASPLLEPDKGEMRQPPKEGIRAALSMSWELASADAQQLGRVLSLFEPIDLPWELVEAVTQAYAPKSTAPPLHQPPFRKTWWQRLWDSLGQLLRTFFPSKPHTVPVVQPSSVVIDDLSDAKIMLRRLSLLQVVERGRVYRLHRLVHEFCHAQWQDADQEGWRNAWLQALSDRAKKVPQFIPHEAIPSWQLLRPHFESAQKVVSDLRKSNPNPDLTTMDNILSGGCLRLGRVQIFEATYRRAIDAHDQAMAALAVGESAMARKYFADAVAGYQSAIEQARLALPENSMILAGYLHRIAVLFYELGKYREGIPPAEEAVKIANLKASPLKLANYLNDLASIYYFQGDHSEAEPLYVRALEIDKRIYGADHPDVATSLNNLAELYKSQGKYSEAEPLYVRSLEIRERQLGADHPHVATSLNNLALLYESQGKYSEAEPLYVRSLEIRERQLGADHPHVATSLNNLAALYVSQGKYSEAEPLYLRSLKILERQLGADHPDVATSLNNLAGLYKSQGKYNEAEPLLVRSLEILERQLGADHPTVARSLFNLSVLYHETARPTAALNSIQRAIQIYEQVIGVEHPNTQAARSWLPVIKEKAERLPP
jgi:tetratricopeptide (TPR) repeat protein